MANVDCSHTSLPYLPSTVSRKSAHTVCTGLVYDIILIEIKAQQAL